MYDEIFIIAKFFIKKDEKIFATTMQIHELIKNERINAGLTEAQMAAKLGVKRSTYQYWEKETPSIDKVRAIARALGLNDEYFFGLEDQKIVNSPEVRSEPTAMQILSMLAEAFKDQAAAFKDQAAAMKAQADTMRSIESKMALESSLQETLAGVETIADRQEKAIETMNASFAVLKRKRTVS
jgi:transcriptional regulator with XRE-family HTH domain